MAEKRTKADKLRRSIERTERRPEARPEEIVAEDKQETVIGASDPTRLDKEIRGRAHEHEVRRENGHDLDEAA